MHFIKNNKLGPPGNGPTLWSIALYCYYGHRLLGWSLPDLIFFWILQYSKVFTLMTFALAHQTEVNIAAEQVTPIRYRLCRIQINGTDGFINMMTMFVPLPKEGDICSALYIWNGYCTVRKNQPESLHNNQSVTIHFRLKRNLTILIFLQLRFTYNMQQNTYSTKLWLMRNFV